MSLADPFLVALSEVFEAFGIPPDLAPLVATLVCIFFLFIIFLNLVNSFIETDNDARPYLFVIFFVGVCVLGFLPMWVLFVTVIGGAIYLLISYLVGGEA